MRGWSPNRIPGHPCGRVGGGSASGGSAGGANGLRAQRMGGWSAGVLGMLSVVRFGALVATGSNGGLWDGGVWSAQGLKLEGPAQDQRGHSNRIGYLLQIFRHPHRRTAQLDTWTQPRHLNRAGTLAFASNFTRPEAARGLGSALKRLWQYIQYLHRDSISTKNYKKKPVGHSRVARLSI